TAHPAGVARSAEELAAARRIERLEALFEAGWVLDLPTEAVGERVAEPLGLPELRRMSRTAEGAALHEEADDRPAELSLSGEAAEVAGAVLTAGSVWWALRAGGLVTSLMGVLPTWRHVDLLAVLPDDDGAEAWDRDADDDEEAQRDEAAFDRLLDAAPPTRFPIDRP
ncbi:MAG TPA: hypothetical protein PKE61_13335, partial [Burkholderiaceae bacterium]|nr:hypothetical protein [Burkholderiaceae bacterium]